LKICFFDDKINKSSFDNSAFSKWIDKNDLFICCLNVLSDKKELKHYKSLYKELLPEKTSDYGNIEYDILNNINLYGQILNFIKPLLSGRLESYLIKSDFLKKCTWLDDFKIQYEPYISKFKTLKF